MHLGYVSRQLGHADVTTTARHYAKWIEGDEYREPIPLETGEVPADLLAWIAQDSPSSPHVEPDAEEQENEEPREAGDLRGSGGWTRTNDLRLMKPPL